MTTNYQKPAITVITPTLNAANTIEDNLKSVAIGIDELRKNNEYCEHLIIDGGSTDDTMNIVQLHAKSNSFCCLIKQKGAGAYNAMNEGLIKADGEYSQIINADDILINPRQWACMISEIKCIKKAIVISSIIYFHRPGIIFDSTWKVNKPPTCKGNWYKKIIAGLHHPHPGFIARTEIYRAVSFDEKYTLSADYKAMHKMLINTKIEEIGIYENIFIAMDKNGASSTWQGIKIGMEQIKQINLELGIKGSIWQRYAGKAMRRILHNMKRIINSRCGILIRYEINNKYGEL